MNSFWEPKAQPTTHGSMYNEQNRYYESVEFVDEQVDTGPQASCALKQRRASHNAVERRRRDTITEKIKELDSIIPEDFYEPGTNNMSTSEKHYKSAVLRRSCEYMRHLESQLEQAKHNQEALLRRLALTESSTDPIIGTLGQQPLIKQEPLYMDHIE